MTNTDETFEQTLYEEEEGADACVVLSSVGRKRLFSKELRCMMFGFGDDQNPYTESVDIIEDLVIEFITEMTHRAMEIGRPGRVQVEDIVFLVRKDARKYARVKDLLTMNEELKRARKAFDEVKYAGGGLSGLSASYYALRRNPKESITLIESSNRVGGWIRSTINEDKVVFEQAARTIRPRGKTGTNTLKLLEDLELSSSIVPIKWNHKSAKNRLIYAKNELHLLPSSLQGLLKRHSPFSKSLALQMAKDVYTRSEKQKNNDESIYNFTRRRFGSEIADYLISPMICGICAGDAKEISVKFLMEHLFDNEQAHGSITAGFVRNLFKKHKKAEEIVDSLLLKRSRDEHWNVYYMNQGLEMLPRRLFEKTKDFVDYKLNNSCIGIDFHKDSITLNLNSGEKLHCDHLISSISAEKLGKLLEENHPNLAGLLKKIENVSLAVVNLQYNKGDLIKTPGFGFLVCPQENLPILGVIYDSCCFDYKDKTVLTVMMGGHWFKKYFSEKTTNEEFLQTALTNVGKILQIDRKPDEYQVNVLHNAIPQYKVGHKETVNKISQYLCDKKLNLSICGSSYFGVGINDVVLSAKNAVDQLKT